MKMERINLFSSVLKEIDRRVVIFTDFYAQPLILTDQDETSVEELRKKGNCLAAKFLGEKFLENLRDTQKVFYREEGEQWALSSRKG